MTSDVSALVESMTAASRTAAQDLLTASSATINEALRTMAKLLDRERDTLRTENERDLELARTKGLSPAMMDRLTLSERAFASMIDGLQVVAGLTTSVGRTYDERVRPNGLEIHKVRVPLGVVAIIYESRPNVTVDAAAICLKSHNAVILRGGSESFHSNTALAHLFSRALSEHGLPPAAVQLVPTTARSAVDELLKMEGRIDLVIPRGGEGLIRTVVEKSRIPVVKHYKGVCHVFVSRDADMAIALPIVVNAKVQRPGVCNAMETLLLDGELPAADRRSILTTLAENKVELYGDDAARALCPGIRPATESDWEAEYLDLRLAVRTVEGLQGAIDHINRFGSHHTDAIVTRSEHEASRFITEVDSASVMVNTSTRFSDGGEYGMGCEIGISTDKLHARGPMGVDDLTTYKWIVRGNGQIRQ